VSLIRVDFYLLSNNQPDASYLLACRLLEKATLQGHRIFVCCNSLKEAEHLDELLWTYKDDSFIPHNLQGEGPEPPPPVQIGYGTSEPRGFNDVLMNLSSTIPSFKSKFKRIIEIVEHNEPAKELSRNRYREYRAHQYELRTHPIG
jgi:DNA polymerase-3 subunit chi